MTLAEWLLGQKLFQNMRASRATELVKDFPEHVVTAWMGHSKRIAQKHYLQVTEEDYKQASSTPTQNPTHIYTKRLSLSSSNCFSHCLVPILSRLLSRNWWGAWWKGSSFASIYTRIPSSTSRGQTPLGFPTHPLTTKFQTYIFSEKHVLIPWRSADASDARKWAPFLPAN